MNEPKGNGVELVKALKNRKEKVSGQTSQIRALNHVLKRNCACKYFAKLRMRMQDLVVVLPIT